MNAASYVRAWGTYIVLALLVVIISLTTENFATRTTLTANLQTLITTVVIASAVTLLMVAGSLDLSVGGVMALSGVVSAYLAAVEDWSIWLAFAAGLVVGALFGLLNGLLVVRLGVNAVIATIGSGLYLALGAANLIAQSRGGTVSGVPPEFRDIGTKYVGEVPLAVIIMIGFVALMVFLEKFTLVGKYSIAMGSNNEGARLSGISVDNFKTLLFVISGASAGLAGILVTSRLGAGVPNVGSGVEFDVIVAAVLGGVSLAGGRGTVLATCAGAAMLVVIQSALNMNGVNAFWQLIITGILLIAMVVLDVILRGGADRPQWMDLAFLRRGRSGFAAPAAPAAPATTAPAGPADPDSARTKETSA
jgi:ribose transport system permease protein